MVEEEKPVTQNPLIVGTNQFFSGSGLNNLAKAHQVETPQNTFDLVGGFPEGEDLDDFLLHIYKSRET